MEQRQHIIINIFNIGKRFSTYVLKNQLMHN
jgi:aspartate 1-decarboxylase